MAKRIFFLKIADLKSNLLWIIGRQSKYGIIIYIKKGKGSKLEGVRRVRKRF